MSRAPALAAVVLAAGRGERMRPLTDLRPKVLLPIGSSTLLDLALDRLAAHAPASATAVNAHYLADQVVEHVGDRATVSVEQPVALGTAGALGRLRNWLNGRPVLLTNGDVYQPGDLAALLEGWDGERCRLLVTAAGPRRADFVDAAGSGVRYVGSCLLPWSAVAGLAAEPSGLYEVLWRRLDAQGLLDLVPLAPGAVSLDCGTPADYLAANLHATGGRSSVGPGAQVLGSVERCVVWPRAWVGPGEHLHDAIRAGSREHPVTVTVA